MGARKSRWTRPVVLLALVWAVAEASAGGALWAVGDGLPGRTLDAYLSADQLEGIRRFVHDARGWYYEFDSDLGWAPFPGASAGGATQNSVGARSLREYAATPCAGVLRVAAFGDSFVHGDEVVDGEEWAALVEATCPSIEVMNFGVSGYGPDQALLRFRKEAAKHSPEVVLIGFMSENGGRTVNVFRPFYHRETGFLLAKPRFRLDGEGLELIPNPLDELADYEEFLRRPGEHLHALAANDGYAPPRITEGLFDFLPSVWLTKLVRAEVDRRGREDLDPTWPTSERFQLSRRILIEFAREVKEMGARPIIVLFPDLPDVERVRSGQVASYAPLAEAIEQEVGAVLDLAPALASAWGEVPDLFAEYHYSPRGNRIVADRILAELTRYSALTASEPVQCHGLPGGTRHSSMQISRCAEPHG